MRGNRALQEALVHHLVSSNSVSGDIVMVQARVYGHYARRKSTEDTPLSGTVMSLTVAARHLCER